MSAHEEDSGSSEAETRSIFQTNNRRENFDIKQQFPNRSIPFTPQPPSLNTSFTEPYNKPPSPYKKTHSESAPNVKDAEYRGMYVFNEPKYRRLDLRSTEVSALLLPDGGASYAHSYQDEEFSKLSNSKFGIKDLFNFKQDQSLAPSPFSHVKLEPLPCYISPYTNFPLKNINFELVGKVIEETFKFYLIDFIHHSKTAKWRASKSIKGDKCEFVVVAFSNKEQGLIIEFQHRLGSKQIFWNFYPLLKERIIKKCSISQSEEEVSKVDDIEIEDLEIKDKALADDDQTYAENNKFDSSIILKMITAEKIDIRIQAVLFIAKLSIAKNTAIFNFEMISALVKALNEAQIAPTYCNISHGIKLAVVTTLSTISALDAEFCKLIEQAEATEILFSIACKFNIDPSDSKALRDGRALSFLNTDVDKKKPSWQNPAQEKWEYVRDLEIRRHCFSTLLNLCKLPNFQADMKMQYEASETSDIQKLVGLRFLEKDIKILESVNAIYSILFGKGKPAVVTALKPKEDIRFAGFRLTYLPHYIASTHFPLTGISPILAAGTIEKVLKKFSVDFVLRPKVAKWRCMKFNRGGKCEFIVSLYLKKKEGMICEFQHRIGSKEVFYHVYRPARDAILNLSAGNGIVDDLIIEDDKKDEIDLEKAGDEVDSLTDTSEFNTDIVTNMIKSSRIEIRLEAAYLLVKMSAKSTIIIVLSTMIALNTAFEDAINSPAYCDTSHAIRLAIASFYSSISKISDFYRQMIVESGATKRLIEIACNGYLAVDNSVSSDFWLPPVQDMWESVRELELRRQCASTLANLCVLPSFQAEMIAQYNLSNTSDIHKFLSLLDDSIDAKLLEHIREARRLIVDDGMVSQKDPMNQDLLKAF